MGFLLGRLIYRGNVFWGFYDIDRIACVPNAQLSYENQITHSSL